MVLLSNDPRIRKSVKEALAPLEVVARKVTVDTLPTRKDRVAGIVTVSAINSEVSFMTMRLDSPLIFVLPEAVAALGKFVSNYHSPQEGGDLILAGADLARLSTLLRAEMNTTAEQEVLL